MGSVAGKQPQRGAGNSYNISYRRRAHHAGSWYDDTEKALNETLSGFLRDAAAPPAVVDDNNNDDSTTTPITLPRTRLRAIVCPHAGYSYSGPTAAYSYAALQQELNRPDCPIKTILVLHPSHHVYLQGCAVSGATVLETPVGNLQVDNNLRQELIAAGCSVMDQKTDEHEHSGEMQYPYLCKLIKDNSSKQDVQVLPVMCGNLSTANEAHFGALFAATVARPSVVTVVSTDFCHWGSRFSYQPTDSDNKSMPLHEFIKRMDRRGMDLIELQKPGAFADYLKETKNTICGRHAVAVWMRAVEAAGASCETASSKLQVQFVRYAQSSAAVSMTDSSVSYAAAVATTIAET